MRNKIFFLTILCLFYFKCEGPTNWFYIYNNTWWTINLVVKPVSLRVKNFRILPNQKSGQNDESLIGGFGIKKHKPSEYLEYLTIIKEDRTVLFDLRDNDLDIYFKIESETESSITYRLDVN